MRVRTTSAAACAVLLAVTSLAGCNREAGSGSGGGKVGIDLPRSDSDFWNSYQQYVEKGVKAGEVDALSLTNSQNDIGKLVANVQTFTDQGAKAVVMAPQDTGAIAESLQNLSEKKIPVVSVDTRPDKGQVYMVVRADNRAYGEKACTVPGRTAEGQGQGRRVPGRPVLHQRPRPLRGVQVLHEQELPRHQGLRAGHRLEGRCGLRQAPVHPRRPPRHQRHLHAGGRRLPAAHARAAGAEEAAEGRRAPRGTSRSSPTTASRRSWTPSRPGRSTPPSPSPPTCTPSTRCTTRRRRWTGRPSRRVPPTTTPPSSRSRTASRTSCPRRW